MSLIIELDTNRSGGEMHPYRHNCSLPIQGLQMRLTNAAFISQNVFRPQLGSVGNALFGGGTVNDAVGHVCRLEPSHLIDLSSGTKDTAFADRTGWVLQRQQPLNLDIVNNKHHNVVVKYGEEL